MLYEFCYKCEESIESENLYHCLDCESEGKDVNFCENCESSQLHGHPNDHHFLKSAGALTKFERIHYLQKFFTSFLDQQLIKANVHIKDNQFEDAAKLCEQGLGATTNIIQKYNKLFNLQDQCVAKIIINIKNKIKRSYTSPNYKPPKVYNKQCDADKIAQNNEAHATACKKAYKQSQEQLENGNINEALKYLNETLIWDQKHAKANRLIEKIKLIQNNFSKAEELIEKSKFNEALKIYEDIIYLHPNDFNNKIKLKQAECFFLLGQYDKVEEILNSVSTSSKKITEFYYVTGHYRYYKGSLSEAKENFESACNLDKNHTKALNMLEKCKSLLIYIDKADSLSQSRAAIQEYSKAIDMIPKNDQKNYAVLCSLFVKRAQVNLNMNNRNACITDCSNALEIDETYWQALFLRAKAYKSSGNHRQCITDCEEAIKFSDSVEVRILLIETEIELDKNNSRTHYDLLGISRQASDKEIFNAYRKTARKFHPDKYSKVPSTLKTAITKLMQKTNRAYETLKDKNKKQKYDDEIRSR